MSSLWELKMPVKDLGKTCATWISLPMFSSNCFASAFFESRPMMLQVDPKEVDEFHSKLEGMKE